MHQYADDLIASYRQVTTATLTMVLLKNGLRNVWMNGAFALADNQPRVVGPAFTMRFIPGREDMATPSALAAPGSTRAAVEAMPDGCVAIIAADGCREAGVLGDILIERMKARQVAAMITDGVVRDLDGVRASGFPVWAQGTAAPASIAALTFVGWQQPIGCGGVAVFPGDLIVADNDGAVVIPMDVAPTIIDQCLEQERFEAWVVDEVRKGQPLPGLYPPNEETTARYKRDTGQT
jgi:regulator of RNase E activity RraA